MADLPPITVFGQHDSPAGDVLHTAGNYISLIWTSRLNEADDFELKIHASNNTAANYLLIGRWVRLAAVTSEDRYPPTMVIHTREFSLDSEHGAIWTIKGWCLTYALLGFRPGQWRRQRQLNATITGTIDNVMWTLVRRRLTNFAGGTGTAWEVDDRMAITNRVLGSVPTDPTTYAGVDDSKPLFETLSHLSKNTKVGFRVDADIYARGLVFATIGTRSRSAALRNSTNSSVQPVIFAPALDTIEDLTHLTSNKDMINTIYFQDNDGYYVSSYADRSFAYSGLDRRVMVMQVRDRNVDEGETVANYNRYMRAIADDEFAKNRSEEMYTVSSTPNSYEFGKDYVLGDIVTSSDRTGSWRKDMQVVEHIYAVDQSGVYEYPTLSYYEG